MFVLSAVLLLACTGGTVAPSIGPVPMVDHQGGFWDAPWPSDARLAEGGGPSMQGFPGVDQYPLVELYAGVIEDGITGASTTAPVYFRFDGPLDTELLPTPRGSLYPEATVFLMDVDAHSPERGRRFPVKFHFQEQGTTYQDSNLLAVAPLAGTPLRPDTTYAAVITTGIAQVAPSMEGAFLPKHPQYATWLPLAEVLFEQGQSTDVVAVANLFTTQDPIGETEVIARSILSERFSIQDLDQSLELRDSGVFHETWEGRVWIPLWQHGERPYATEGGGFRVEEGHPLLAGWEHIRVSVTRPRKQEMPAEGWPVVLYAHGTFGDWNSCCVEGSGMGQAARAAQAGAIMVGFSQPHHGDRAAANTNIEAHTFNYFNPESARATFRQGALDIVYLAKVLSGRQHRFDLDGEELLTNPEMVLFMGHSQGGITGAIALPFLSTDQIKGAVLSGAGGGLALSMVYRKEGDLDIEALITGVLEFTEDEVLDEMHPVAAMVQTAGEVTDSLNYSPYWLLRRGAGGGPIPVLMFEGLLDEHTPPMTTEALASAGGLPLLRPASAVSDAARILRLDDQSTPAQGNVLGWDGVGVTAGLAQYPNQNHFAIHNDPDAADLYRDFMASVIEGDPKIGAPY